MLQDNKFIEIGPNMLNLIQNCNHVATGGKFRSNPILTICRFKEPCPPNAEQGLPEESGP